MTTTEKPTAGEASTAEALGDLLCFDLYAASRAVTARYRPLLGDLGLTYPQYLVMRVLREQPHTTIGVLAKGLHLDHGTLTPLLRRLEEAGLLTRLRGSDDERVVHVRLTDAGAALCERFDEVECAMADAMGLSREGAAALQDQLRVLRARMDGSG